jgi:predicted TIM-barrel fold metal-dependent hydrolase
VTSNFNRLSGSNTLMDPAGPGLCCACGSSAGAAAGITQHDHGETLIGAGGPTRTKIDIYNHVMPTAYLELLKERNQSPGMVRHMSGMRMLWDMDARADMLNQWPGLQQVLTLTSPGPESLGGPEESPQYARAANDAMAQICAQYPQKFPFFIAALPMNNVTASLIEMDRAIGTLGARGIEIKTSVNGRPLDDPEFFAIFERATNHHGVPIWMHPIRSGDFTDYASESHSRYEIFQVMGWPYETTAAMARIVFSGMLDRLPDMRIVTHHCGGMLPFFGGRAEGLWAQLGSRHGDEDYSAVLKNLKKPFMDYFRMFYGDTVLGGSSSALRCGLDFFGPDHVVFASDCPFDPEGGPMFIRDGIRSIEALGLSDEIKQKIYVENALTLLRSHAMSAAAQSRNGR